MGFQVVRDIETNSLEGIALGISYETMRPIFVSIDQTLENLKNLLLTRKGERFYQPLFGSDLLEILFEPNISELKQEIQSIVDFMIQIEAMRDKISALKKDIKEEYGIPVATITKVATIVRKENLSEEEEKWEEIKEFVEACS